MELVQLSHQVLPSPVRLSASGAISLLAAAVVAALLVPASVRTVHTLESAVASAASSTIVDTTRLISSVADDVVAAKPGVALTDGSLIPARAEAGIRTTSATGEQVKIGLPAAGSATQETPGSLSYAGLTADTRVVVDRVAPASTPGAKASTRSQIVIGSAAAPTRFKFDLTLPAGATLGRDASGAVFASNADGKILGLFAAPWAIDARGASVPTKFEIDGNAIVQVVDHSSAAYPVVADPWWFVPVVIAGRAVVQKMAVRAATASAARQAAIRAAQRAGQTVRSAGPAVRGNFFSAAGHTIRVGGTFTRKNGYTSFTAFKRANPGRKGFEWHHIVEKTNVGRFKSWEIHNKQNLILIPTGIHRQCVTAMMNTSLKNLTTSELRRLGLTRTASTANLTMRQMLTGYSLRNMHLIGLRLLSFCGVKISGV